MKRRIAEGSVTGSTIIQRSDSTRWATASDFTELGVNDVVTSRYDHENGPDALTQEIEEYRFKRAVRAGAGWFFWIAALSLINAGSAYVASTARLHSAPLIETAPGYALGLSVVYPLGEFGARFGGMGALLALALNIGLVLFYLFCGVAGWKKYFTPYLLGMSFYAGDTALAFLAGDWISAGIHVLALLFLYCGLDALLENRQMTWANGSLLRAGVLAIAVAAGGWACCRSSIIGRSPNMCSWPPNPGPPSPAPNGPRSS